MKVDDSSYECDFALKFDIILALAHRGQYQYDFPKGY